MTGGGLKRFPQPRSVPAERGDRADRGETVPAPVHRQPGVRSGRDAPRPGNLRASAGTGEIRVPSTHGTAFAAPHLIGHSVADHGYLPPKAFIDAVFGFDPHGLRRARFPGVRFPWIPGDAALRHIDDE